MKGRSALPQPVARGQCPDRRPSLTARATRDHEYVFLSLHPLANPTVLHVCSRSEGAQSCRNSLLLSPSAFCFRLQLRPRLFSAGPSNLSATPFTFGPSSADQFSLSYPVSGFFNDTFVSTTGTAEVSSFGGFLGIPVEPSTFFTDMRNGSDTLFGPDQFGSYASFPTATDIPYSSGDSFLGLQYTVGANTYYGFARFAGGDLEGYGFETNSQHRHRRKFPGCAGPGTFNLGNDDAGLYRGGPRRAPPIVSPRLTAAVSPDVIAALPFVIPAYAGIQRNGTR